MRLFLGFIFACSALVLALPPRVAAEEPGSTTLAACSQEGRALIEASRDGDQSRHYLRILTSHFPRRMTGSSGIRIAVDWARETFEHLELDARLEAWGEVQVGFDRGPAKGRQLEPVEQELTFITPAWSPGTVGPTRAKAVLEPATRAAAEAHAEELRGAWIVRGAEVGEAAAHDLDRYYEQLGVSGVIVPGESDGRLIMHGDWSVDFDALPSLVRVTLLYEQHTGLLESLAAGEACELEFDIENKFLHGPHSQYNVVADLRGTEFPDEYVIVQAHIDDWDGAQGACDNGTGVATTLEAARLLTSLGRRPRRTIRFVLYTGAEQGLLGSRGYVEAHADELEKISVVLNHDGGTNFVRGLAPTPAMLADFEQVFASIKTLDEERPFELGLASELKFARMSYQSDDLPFRQAGVPAFLWQQSPEGYLRLRASQFDNREQVKPDDQRHSSLVIALAAWRFAELDHLLDRTQVNLLLPRGSSGAGD